MLQLLEGFDSIASMRTNGMTSTCEMNVVTGRTYGGNALEIKSSGCGLFFNLFMLPAVFTTGCLGLAVLPHAIVNSLSVIFHLGSVQQFTVVIRGNGSITVSRSGIEMAQTGGHRFSNTEWVYVEVCMKSDQGLIVAIDGRPVLIVARMGVSFDRFSLSIPDQQTTGLDVDDLYFDDLPLLHGDVTVLNQKMSYIPTHIHGVATSQAMMNTNPNGTPWTFRDVVALTDCRSVLASINTSPIPITLCITG